MGFWYKQPNRYVAWVPVLFWPGNRNPTVLNVKPQTKDAELLGQKELLCIDVLSRGLV